MTRGSRRLRPWPSVVVLALAVAIPAAVLAGCGGGGEPEAAAPDTLAAEVRFLLDPSSVRVEEVFRLPETEADRADLQQPQDIAFDETGRLIALTDQECDALMNAAIASPDPDLWLFVAFGLNTAMRHREITSARWDRLDFANRRLFIQDAKAGQREQPITAELAELLTHEREMRDDREGWIFPSPRGDSASGHRDRMDRAFRQAVKAAGLEYYAIGRKT